MLQPFRAEVSPAEKKQLLGRVDAAMHRQIDRLLQRQIEQKLSKDAKSIKPPIREKGDSDRADEVKVIMQFDVMKQRHNNELKEQQLKNAQLEERVKDMQKTIQELHEREAALKKQLSMEKEDKIVSIRQKQLLETTVLQLQVQYTAKEAQLQEELSKINHKLSQSQIQNTNTQQILSQMMQKLSQVQKEAQNATKQRDALFEEWKELEAELQIVTQQQASNLMTSNILAAQLNQNYQQIIQYYSLSISSNLTQRNIISTINKINTSLNYQLESMQSPLQSSSPSFSQLESITTETQTIKMLLETYRSKVNQLATNLQHQTSEISKRQSEVYRLKNEKNELQEREERLKDVNNSLQQQLQQLKDTNYQVLIQLQTSKAKLQNKIEELQQHIQHLSHLNQSQEQQITLNTNKFQQLATNHQQLKQELEDTKEHLRSSQQQYAQLQEEYTNMKENLQIVIKTESDEGDNNFTLLEQLVEKNNSIVHQLALKKQAYAALKIERDSLKLDLAKLQINESDKQSQLCDLQEDFHEIQVEVEDLRKVNANLHKIIKEHQDTISQHLDSLSLKDEIINALQTTFSKQIVQAETNKPVFADANIQTDFREQVAESRIRRQNILNKSVKSEVEKSHSLLSEQQDNKQNTPQSNHLPSSFNDPKLKLRSQQERTVCRGPCEHKEKIGTLNELINYMVNHCKGYGRSCIRQHSWLSYQIQRQGEDYQMKVCQEKNMLSKIKNMAFIEELCSKEQACRLLIKDFENIMDYYFRNCSTESHENMSKTVNKFRRGQNSCSRA